MFEVHRISKCHKTSLTYDKTIPKCKDVGVMFNSDTERKREIERKYFRNVMETVQELGREGIPFQGDECNDTFRHVLVLRGNDDPEVAKRVLNNTDPKLKKYTHYQYQNELIDIMAKHVLRLKLSEIHQSMFLV